MTTKTFNGDQKIKLTQKLADNFSPYLQYYNSFLMENHGIVTMSPDTIEWTPDECRITRDDCLFHFKSIVNRTEIERIER